MSLGSSSDGGGSGGLESGSQGSDSAARKSKGRRVGKRKSAFSAHARALLLKRFRYARRDWRTLVCQM